MRRLLLVLVFLLLGFVAYAGWQAYRVYNDVQHIVVAVPRATDEPTVIPSAFSGTHRINILVLGSDTDRKKEEARPLAQSMIVVTIDPVHDKVGMLSIPRDFWVPIPHHGWGKIDLAYKYGGVALARQTVERLFPMIKIDYYAWVGLNGFINVINTFGGVTIDATHPILDDTYPNDLSTSDPYGYMRVFIPAGWQHMDGSQALQYVRSRHGDLIGDFGRSQRQQQVLLRLRSEASGQGLISHVFTLADELQQSVRTDVGPGNWLAVERLSQKLRPQDIQQKVLAYPQFCNYAMIRGQSVLTPYWNKIYAAVRPMFAPVQQPAPTAIPTPTPARTPQEASATPTPAPTAAKSASATPRPTSTPRPTATPAPPAFHQLTGGVLFVKSGNLYELRGGQVRQLTRTGDVAMPAPNPRNPNIVAVVRFPAGQFVSDIWLLNVRTGVMTRVTDGRSHPFNVPNNLWAAWPTWTSDGSRLLYSWDAWKLAYPASESRHVDLAVYARVLASKATVQITKPNLGAGGDEEPVARPGSSAFAYVKWNYIAQSNQPYSQLAIHDWATGAESLLTPPGGRILDPSWDAHGNRLVYVRRTPAGQDQVVVAPVVRSGAGWVLGARTLVASGAVAQPGFSPGGKWVMFLRPEAQGFSLWVASSSGGQAKRVGALGASLDGRWRPVWVR